MFKDPFLKDLFAVQPVHPTPHVDAGEHDQGPITGEVTLNTIGVPNPNVVENINTAPDGTITGSVTVDSSRVFRVEGFVRTSHGRIATNVRQSIQFSSRQDFNITNTAFAQNIKQRTTISSETQTDGHGGGNASQQFDWPLDLGFTFSVNPDGTGQQTTTIRQQFQSAAVHHGDNGPASFSVVSNTVTPSDTLLFDANFNITGSTGQQNAQDFFSNDSVSGCFSRQITASAGLLTSITDGALCKKGGN